MSYITKACRPSVTRHVLSQLAENVGHVSGLYMFWLLSTRNVDAIFKVLHVVKTMLTREFKYVVNQSSKIKVFIRASWIADNAILEAVVSKLFQFDFCTVRVLKIHELNLKTISKDRLLSSPIRSFPASYDQLLPSRMAMHGYPSGYSSQGDNIEKFQNPSMSSTTMSLLGIHEGEQKDLLNVIIKYYFGPKLITHAMHVIPEGF
jgi:hypothetical protein